MTDTAAQSLALSMGISALVTVACRRMKLPALLPLLAVGLAMGTSGVGLIEADSLGGALRGFITVAIGLLIFEGGLNLNEEEFSRAPRAVWGLLTIGAIVTWVGAAVAAHFIAGMSWPIAILLGAIVIVTGPTVVQPILRLLRITPRAHTALAAEAVLIDPIGVVTTITTLEVVRLSMTAGPSASLAGTGLLMFVKPMIGGAGVGLVMGIVGSAMLRLYGRSGRVEAPLLNLIAVGVCMTCVGLGEAVASEAGLAAVTICSVLMARTKVLGATELKAFKELLAVMLVGTLFVLLASRFDIRTLEGLGKREAYFVLALIFIVRPVSVLLSTIRSNLNFRERLFVGTFAPRGIVALSVATVVGADLQNIDLSQLGQAADQIAADIDRLEPMMFLVITGSVLLASTYSPLLALVLRLRSTGGTSLIIIGGHALGQAFAQAVRSRGVECRIIDSNEQRAAAAATLGLDAMEGDATDSRWMDDVGAPHAAGWLIAWTGNHDVDQLAARWAVERLGEGRAAIWSARPVRGPLADADISGNEEVTAVIDKLQDGLVRVVASPDPSGMRPVLARVSRGQFSLVKPGDPPPTPAENCSFIGIVRTASDLPEPAVERGTPTNTQALGNGVTSSSPQTTA
jgi:NhaP-type Na+/H+ or K+/H+ antiporter